MVPQQGPPDRRVHEINQFAGARIAQTAVRLQRVRQAPTQPFVQRRQHPCAFDDPAESGLSRRFERRARRGIGLGCALQTLI